MDTGSRKQSFNLFFKNIDVRLSYFSRTDRVKEAQSKYIYVICQPEGPYWEKQCQRSWVRPKAAPKTKSTVFPNTDRPRPANNVFFRRVLCKQLLGWIFTAAIFKPGVRVRLTFRKMVAVVIWIHNCLFLRSLFTFYVLCSEKKKTAGKDTKAGKLVAVRKRMGKSGPLERAQLANQIQGFRIPDRSDAWENNKYMLFAGWEGRIAKNCDRGLGNEVTAFHYTDRP